MISTHSCEHLVGEECFACQIRDQAAHREAVSTYIYGATDSPIRSTPPDDDSPIRTFESGATRDTEDGKLDPEGFLSPLVVVRYSQYMDKHRTQSDGTRRDSDNWQRGIPRVAYMKSLWRHFLDVWLLHRGHPPIHSEPDYDLQEALCAVIFNASGYLESLLRD